MPELPEVETVRRALEPEIKGLVISSGKVIYPRLIQGIKPEEFVKRIAGKKIEEVARKGKFLIIRLSDTLNLLVHFRMEGKLFHLPKLEENLTKYVTCYFSLNDGTYLIFSDVRKFGVMFLKADEELFTTYPLNELGKEPWDIPDGKYLLKAYKGKNYMAKEAMLDQKVISGLGNIYADEVLFRSKVNPFKAAKDITKDEADRIVVNAREVLTQAINEHGSTIRTYHPTKGTSGNMQNLLNAYGREGEKCVVCGTKMEKKYVGGRGTTYCPCCQHVAFSIAITGKIAVGKSQVRQMFASLGCYTASADDMVHALYASEDFNKKLQAKFPSVFLDGELNKSLVMKNMLADKKFRRAYESFVWAAVKEETNDFLIKHSDHICVCEVPLLFDAHMEKDFSYLVGVESSKQTEYLKIRKDEDVDKRLNINKKTAYDLNRKKLDFIIENNDSKEYLLHQVKDIYSKVYKAHSF